MPRDVFDIRLVLAENNRGFLFVFFLCSGSAMNVAYGPVELKKFLQEAARVSQVCWFFKFSVVLELAESRVCLNG